MPGVLGRALSKGGDCPCQVQAYHRATVTATHHQQRQARPQVSHLVAGLLAPCVTALLCKHLLCCRLAHIPTKSEVMVVRTDGKSCSRELVEGVWHAACSCACSGPHGLSLLGLQLRAASASHTPAASSSCLCGSSGQRGTSYATQLALPLSTGSHVSQKLFLDANSSC